MGLILFPIIFVILINESQRSTHQSHLFKWKKVKTINSAVPSIFKCSWACHNQTTFCKINHVKLLKPYFSWTDPIYFGIIRSLKATGNYGLANLVVLVLLIPMLCLWLFWKIVTYQLRIKEHINTRSDKRQASLLVFTVPVTVIYVYCTDFIIHAANLLDSSYYEINFLFFCFLYPLLLAGLFVLFVIQRYRWKKINHYDT